MHFFSSKEILLYGAFIQQYDETINYTFRIFLFLLSVRLSSNAVSSAEFCVNLPALSLHVYACLWYLFFCLADMYQILLRQAPPLFFSCPNAR